MLQSGAIIRSRYKIIRLLGSGGFGETYLASDLDIPTSPKPKCVVKHLRPQSNNPAVIQIAQNLFNREAEVLYSLSNLHNEIPKLHAHFEEKQEFYLVQEFIDGEDLSKELIPGKRLNEDAVKQLVEDILTVLAVVHERSIIHRDIKPANLMRRHSNGKIVLIDFSAVKEIMTVNATGQTNLTVAIGTAGYMPNEQAAGQPKLCSDVYAVGMVGIYALTGIQPHELPKDPTTGEVIWQNWANVSDKFAAILNKMVLYHFSQRHQNAAEALQELYKIKPKQPAQPQQKPRREVLKTLGWVGAGVGLSVVAGNLLRGNSNQQQSQTPSTPNQPTSKQVVLKSFPFETVTVDARGTIIRRQKQEAKSFVEDLGNGALLEMVQIPGGTFTMGSPVSEAGRSGSESPQRQVTVPAFFMGRYQVTQAQYQAITGNNPSNFKGVNRPVEKVSWNEAVEFCKKLSQKTGRNYRLPSEAEWEYACRAGTTTPFYFGETITTDLVNYNGSVTPYASAPKGIDRQETTEVGKFPPNAFGLYDMHGIGNKLEWSTLCQYLFM